jgi:Putative prokaryotic signal transducing protein
MENLREKVYECSFAVEAHMICDLLARAGISARVDGEFLAGAGGELPLGSNIKVRVDPARAAEAREVIDEWEREQPPPEPAVIQPRSRLRSPMFFLAGLLIGALIMFVGSRSP